MSAHTGRIIDCVERPVDAASATVTSSAPSATRLIDCVERPVDAALWLAAAFTDGRRLVVHAPGAQDHAHHVVVEFVHPVVAGARPLPAAAAEPEPDCQVDSRRDALLVIGCPLGGDGNGLVIDSGHDDPVIVRAYHLLWELVQIALEHPGIVGGDGVAGGDPTGFLYPYLDAAERNEAALRDSLAASAAAKRAESDGLIVETLCGDSGRLEAAVTAVAEAVGQGGLVLTMGNGGSATDAARFTRLLRHRGIRADTLSSDYAVLTALANDIGVQRVFARQVEAFGRAGDVLIGCSTSGSSPNLLAAFDEAQARGLVTVGLSGYGGQSFDAHASIGHSLAVRSSSVHRIQEAQAALIAVLCDRIAVSLAGTAAPSRHAEALT